MRREQIKPGLQVAVGKPVDLKDGRWTYIRPWTVVKVGKFLQSDFDATWRENDAGRWMVQLQDEFGMVSHRTCRSILMRWDNFAAKRDRALQEKRERELRRQREARRDREAKSKARAHAKRLRSDLKALDIEPKFACRSGGIVRTHDTVSEPIKYVAVPVDKIDWIIRCLCKARRDSEKMAQRRAKT